MEAKWKRYGCHVLTSDFDGCSSLEVVRSKLNFSKWLKYTLHAFSAESHWNKLKVNLGWAPNCNETVVSLLR